MKVPLHVDIELTNNCDLRCTMCPQSMPEWRGKTRFGNMDPNMAIDLLQEMKALGVYAMKPNFRGEPLLHKHLEMILWGARDHMTDIRINTNLQGATFPRMYALANLCNLIIVSIDGASKETYEAVRVRGDWGRLNKNLGILQRLCDDGLAELKVQMTVSKDNEHEVDKFHEMFAGISEAKPATDRGQGGEMLCGNMRAVGRVKCGQPFQRLVVGWDGEVYGCCSNWNREFPVGKYPEQSLKEIWEGERMQALRKTALDPDSGSPCKGCDVGSSYQWEII